MAMVARAMVAATRVVGEQIEVALINYRIFFTMIISCQPKLINPKARGGI